MRLVRENCKPTGIFGSLQDDSGNVICVTLEHSYDCVPKVPNGTYKCIRSIHALHDGVKFETFEITGVAGHSGILFHIGNYNGDSSGCVLLGKTVNGDAITNSKVTFNKFMTMLVEVDEFTLTVV